jgi:hypothetical protein
MTISKVYEASNIEYMDEAIERLRSMFPSGSTVTTTIKNVSRSGMGRSIAVLGTDANGQICNVSRDVARVCEWRFDNDRQAVYVSGCGMDMAFHTVYTLAHVLYRTDENWQRAGYLLENRTI